ncbi:MAG: prepilin-type cleavage/methylation protein [Enterococcus gallinarum]|nr:prepilin-type cleavage/methylation protein [Enterococcus gallinarum]MDU4931753.1 prepilin-type cleavage/methylation protein [Enterococcus gallinarum]
MKVTRSNSSKSLNTEKIFSFMLVLLSFVLILLTLNSNVFSNRIDAHDSSMFLYFGKGISEGLIPYKDMFDHKGIVLFFIQYIANIVGLGNIFLGIFLVEAVFLLIALIFLYKTSYLVSRNHLICGVVILISSGLFSELYEGGNLSEEYALTFISISMYYFLKEIIGDSLKSYHYFLLGLMGGLVFFIRLNMISLWVVFCIGIAVREIIKKSFVSLFRKAFYIFLGGMSIVLLIIVFSIMTNSVEEMIFQTFTLNMQYSSTSLKERVAAFIFFFGLFSVYGLPIWFTVLFSKIVIKYREMEVEKRSVIVLILIALILNLFTIVVSGRNYRHYGITEIPFLIVLQCIAMGFYSKKFSRKKNLIVMFVFLFSMLPIFLPTVGERINNVNRKETPSYQSEQLDIARYIKNHSNEDEQIYVHAIDANIYLQSNRFSNSKFFVLPSLNYEEFPKLKNQFTNSLQKNPPKFIVISKNSFLEEHPNDRKLNKILIEKIKQDYHKVDAFDKSYYVFEKQ